MVVIAPVIPVAIVQATASPRTAPGDIAVVARKPKEWRAVLIVEKGEALRCRVIRSTGDGALDAQGCAAMRRCFETTQPPFTAARQAAIPARTRKHLLAEANRLLEACFAQTRLHGAQVFQPETVTQTDRHPALFACIRDHLAGREAPRVLSFGCSTGEEAFMLARYLPDATIDAIDANPACIAQARRAGERRGLHGIRFLYADSPDAVAPARYDAVLCLSVLRHAELDRLMPDRCTAVLPFARFADAVAALDRRLETGGILVLWGCNFRFADTGTAARYRIVPTPAKRPHPGPFYGADDARLSDPGCAAFAFVKVAPA